MEESVIDFISESSHAKTFWQLDKIMSRAIANFGLARFGYVARSLDGVTKDSPLIVRHTYPSTWVNYYMENKYYLDDPVTIQGEKDVLPFEWGGNDYIKQLTKPQAKVFNEGGEYSIRNGFTIPIHGQGCESATMSLVGEERHKDFRDQINEYRHELHIIAIYYHQRIKEIYLGSRENKTSLTNRERECLAWSSVGMTYADIASVLSISRNTVIFHIQNAKRKLGVKSINHAVAKAIQASIIEP
jgi:DNA-binding CsgD family transcriptional regulator